MNKYKVTRYVKELGMTLNTVEESELSIEEYTKEASREAFDKVLELLDLAIESGTT